MKAIRTLDLRLGEAGGLGEEPKWIDVMLESGGGRQRVLSWKCTVTWSVIPGRVTIKYGVAWPGNVSGTVGIGENESPGEIKNRCEEG